MQQSPVSMISNFSTTERSPISFGSVSSDVSVGRSGESGGGSGGDFASICCFSASAAFEFCLERNDGFA
uniref:Secreted protein n=1 Tax=Ascaris lumbricoides TaxID=6252 RepID=A0A0M3IBN6_ASCLU